MLKLEWSGKEGRKPLLLFIAISLSLVKPRNPVLEGLQGGFITSK